MVQDELPTIKCGACDLVLDEVMPSANMPRNPCPGCGSLLRTVVIPSFEEGFAMSEYFSSTATRSDGPVGFFESEREGRVSSASESSDGRMDYSLTGTPPQGEEDTMNACRILVAALNKDGARWSPPSAGSGVADAVIRAVGEPSNVREIQVVRAVSDPEFWRRLRSNGGIEEKQLEPERLAKLLRESVESKLKKVAPSARVGLILALNATRLPVFGLASTIRIARLHDGNWMGTLGFDKIWVVGPQEALTARLDSPVSPIDCV